jgi:hypothetical protein
MLLAICIPGIFESNCHQAKSVRANVRAVKKFPTLRIQLSDRLFERPRISAPMVGMKIINVRRAESFMVAQRLPRN